MPNSSGNGAAMANQFRVIRDPVHDYVRLPIALNEMIDHPFMQRLRRVSQTAMSTSVFPAMTGSRFEHSLGTMHLAQVAWQSLWSRSPKEIQKAFARDVYDDLCEHTNLLDDETSRWRESFTEFYAEFEEKVGLVAASAGLLHDIGHPPFSHSLEAFYERNLDLIVTRLHGVHANIAQQIPGQAQEPFHERVGHRLLDDLAGDIVSKVPWYVVRRVLEADRSDVGWAGALHGLVASEVDVDRLDYLIRDAKRAGTEFWSVDHRRLIDSLELHEVDGTGSAKPRGWTIGYGYRARTAIESLLTNRLRYYQWVLFHPHVAAANRFLDLALQELVDIGGLASMAGTSKSDGEFARRFEELRPNLNYFLPVATQDRAISASPEGSRSNLRVLEDTDSIRLQGDVDDSTVVEWMKRSANLARLVRSEPTVSAGFRARMDRYAALCDAVLFRTPNWAPAWKTEDQFSEVAEALKGELVNVLADLRDEVARLTEASLEGDSSEASRHRVVLNATNALLSKLEADPVLGLNAIAWHILQSSQPTVSARNHRDAAAAILKAAPPTRSSKLRGGFWVLASGRVASTEGDGSEVQVWRKSEGIPLKRLSAMVDSLPEIAASYPQVFAYFIVPDNEQMRVNRYSPHQSDLRRLFLKGFPHAVRTYLLGRLGLENG